MTIILTVNFSPWSPYSGGGQRSVHNLGRHLAGRGHTVHVVYTRAPFESIPIPKDLPYRLHWASLPALNSRRDLFLRPLSANTVSRTVQRILRQTAKPAIVHANGEEAAVLPSAGPAKRFTLVVTPRYSGYPEELAAYPSLSPAGRAGFALKHWKYLRLRQALMKADRICPPSEWAAAEVRRLFPVDPDRVVAVPNGVPPEFLTFSRKADADSGPLLFFGRLSRDKGVDLLLKAYAELPAATRPDLHIAGDGEEREHLTTLASDLGITGSVQFLPWQTHRQLGERLSQAAVCVLPSREENYSLAILSAMAVGAPVISTRTGGTPEIIKDRKTGILVEPDSKDALVAALRQALTNPAGLARMGRQASEEVRMARTWEQTCDKFETIYRDLMKNL